MLDLQHVLLVEDDPDIAVLVTIALTEISGFRVDHCDSAEAAIEWFETHKNPDLLLLDYLLPGLTGEELLFRLRSNPKTASIPVIFMTASVMPKHVSQLRSLGALEVLHKPFDPLILGNQIEAIFRAAGGQA